MKDKLDKIEKFIDAHEEKSNQQISLISWLLPVLIVVIIVFTISLYILSFSSPEQNYLISGGILLFFILLFILLTIAGSVLFGVASFLCLDRNSIIRLIRITQDDDDVQVVIMQRLLSGKFLNGRDEKQILDMWSANVVRKNNDLMKAKEKTLLEGILAKNDKH
ncbi:hypothetical protein ZG96_004457 [Salmonella enterica subsp. enterica serovar Java]|nr:hypothetical protein [Salmonella enterica subsp. enterica serovar Java]EJC3483663.1 hypothetical protein [Salmonella enterica]